jgi:hypothetical protein
LVIDLLQRLLHCARDANILSVGIRGRLH